jgi:hypothetical protein
MLVARERLSDDPSGGSPGVFEDIGAEDRLDLHQMKSLFYILFLHSAAAAAAEYKRSSDAQLLLLLQDSCQRPQSRPRTTTLRNPVTPLHKSGEPHPNPRSAGASLGSVARSTLGLILPDTFRIFWLQPEGHAPF